MESIPIKKIAFIVQLPSKVSPGQRFRFENWIPYLEENGFSVSCFPFMDSGTHAVLYKSGHYIKKIVGTLKGFVKRFRLLFQLKEYDFIFLYREMAPLGPPIFEWYTAKILKKKIIIDFDDAIWISPHESKIFSFIKCYWKVQLICKWAYKVSAGNRYLANYASKYNEHVYIIPTVVDTAKQHNKIKTHAARTPVVVGWTGSHSTLPYLRLVEPILQELNEKLSFDFLVIADRPPDLRLSNCKFIHWNKDTEIDDLLKIDVGLMPLKEDEWSEGKCGFKLIQYLALGIPALASPVGVNKDIIKDNINGFLCRTDEYWQENLELLIKNEGLRKSFGENGRILIEDAYSIRSQKSIFLNLFQ